MSSKKAASEDKLGLIHDLTAEWALTVLAGRDKIVKDEEGKETVVKELPSAAELAVIRAFLKDNDITCAPGGDTKLEELRRKIAESRAPKPATGEFDPARDLPDGATPMQ